MLEIKVTIHCPDLVSAAALLVKHAIPSTASSTAPSSTPEAAVAPAPPAQPASSAPSIPTAPAAPAAPTVPPAPVVPVAPTAPPMPTVPLAQPPQFTLEQISRAGAELITKNPGILPQVNALLGQFGVQTLDKLRPDQMGPFATALRGLGAKL